MKENESLTPRQAWGIILIIIAVICVIGLINGFFPEREGIEASTFSFVTIVIIAFIAYLFILGYAKRGSRFAKKILVKLRF